MGPDSQLLLRSSLVSDASEPSVDGIVPLKKLPCRSSFLYRVGIQ